MKITSFNQDITPPVGHSLCGGWYLPAAGISERLHARGVILAPDHDAPIVLCALDWAELSNLEYRRWCEDLACAAGTTPERVAVHCVHNHDAPWPDTEAQELLDEFGWPGVIMDYAWCRDVRASVAAAVQQSVHGMESVDSIRVGQAEISALASNRRPLGPDGKVIGVRRTRCPDAALRALPEGDIDPLLRTISFWQGERKLVSLHYYTIHPTSYDRTGIVTTDFPGIARERLITEEGTPHLYFTGCAGNVTAGKYNDGVADNRLLFARKIYDAILSSEASARKLSGVDCEWRSTSVVLPGRSDVTDAELLQTLSSPHSLPARASRAAFELIYRRRVSAPIIVSALHFGNEAALLHLPGESFVEYQLYAQSLLPQRWLGTASYGDLGPGYVCLERSFEEGGYEPTDSFCAPESERFLKEAICNVLLP
jgi:hypothetical protein